VALGIKGSDIFIEPCFELPERNLAAGAAEEYELFCAKALKLGVWNPRSPSVKIVS
jgi:hypothetical protein